FDHTASLLIGGRVLVAGGSAGPSNQALAYDPGSGTFPAVGALATARSGHVAVALPEGGVLVAGGAVASAELFDLGTGLWTAAGALSSARSRAAAAVLPSGQVIVAGGVLGGVPLAAADLFDEGRG